jgi:hypothetical protein
MKPNSYFQFCDRLFQLPLSFQRIPQVIVSNCIVWIEAQGFLVGSDRFFQLPLIV